MPLPLRRLGLAHPWSGSVAVAAVVIALVLVGTAIRAWMLWHSSFISDEATVGEMAKQILHGHFYTFYWGQPYGGVEPYLVAPMVAIFGSNPIAVNATATLLAAVLCLAVWRVGRHMFPSTYVGAVAGLLLWVFPEDALWLSTRELGFRDVTMLCGVGLLAATYELLCGTGRRRGWIGFGLALGIGWWSTPEIVYYALPCLAALATGLLDKDFRTSALSRLGALWGALAAVLGALPWLYTNVNSHFESLKRGPGQSTYVDRLHVFFSKVMPILLGQREEGAGRWVFGHGPGVALYVFLLALTASCVLVLLIREPVARPVALVVALFPLIYAVFPPADAWNDGRYGSLLLPALVLVISAGATTAIRWLGMSRRFTGASLGLATISIGTLSVVSTLVAFGQIYGQPDMGFGAILSPFRSSVETTSLQTVAALRRDGVTYGYAQYWIAYKLDYLSNDRLALSAPDQVRWAKVYRDIERSGHPSWLFVNPADMKDAINQFATGDFGMTSKEFKAYLKTHGIGFTERDAGILQVVTPDGNVEPRQLGYRPVTSNIP